MILTVNFGHEVVDIVRLSYDKTFRGLIFRRYRDMKARINGDPHKKAKSAGLELLSRDEFLAWTLADEAYTYYYKRWVDSEYDHSEVPSIHRIDCTKGYFIGNMEWISFGEHLVATVKERRENKREDNWMRNDDSVIADYYGWGDSE